MILKIKLNFNINKKKIFVFNFLTKFITFEKFYDCIKTSYNIMFIKIVSMFRVVT